VKNHAESTVANREPREARGRIVILASADQLVVGAQLDRASLAATKAASPGIPK